MKIKLKSDAKLYEKLTHILDKHDYPIEARNEVGIYFESQQTVDRDSKGSWYHHFK